MYPDGAAAVAPHRVIAAALTDAGMACLGRLTLARRERMVLVEPRGAGMALVTLRAADEVRETGAGIAAACPDRGCSGIGVTPSLAGERLICRKKTLMYIDVL